MFLNALHIRFAAIGAGVVVLGLFLLMGGSLGNPEIVQLDFGMYPELLEGCRVEIDGRVVGTLERTGQSTRAGFEVDEGRHVIRVLHPEMGSEEIEVQLAKGEKARLLLDVVERYDEATRRVHTAIGAQH